MSADLVQDGREPIKLLADVIDLAALLSDVILHQVDPHGDPSSR